MGLEGKPPTPLPAGSLPSYLPDTKCLTYAFSNVYKVHLGKTGKTPYYMLLTSLAVMLLHGRGKRAQVKRVLALADLREAYISNNRILLQVGTSESSMLLEWTNVKENSHSPRDFLDVLSKLYRVRSTSHVALPIKTDAGDLKRLARKGVKRSPRDSVNDAVGTAVARAEGSSDGGGGGHATLLRSASNSTLSMSMSARSGRDTLAKSLPAPSTPPAVLSSVPFKAAARRGGGLYEDSYQPIRLMSAVRQPVPRHLPALPAQRETQQMFEPSPLQLSTAIFEGEDDFPTGLAGRPPRMAPGSREAPSRLAPLPFEEGQSFFVPTQAPLSRGRGTSLAGFTSGYNSIYDTVSAEGPRGLHTPGGLSPMVV
eukprot:TRINITY_DN17179_c0_g1_i1.p1 TRINITY_DN17179_c0_g1~~TRINITY_DN17179_c0_g1_i1.p1  ORF type:complete len:369 (+),score=74.45 TRINITY_DN17179_c0_g1_i1:213-1319(+)